MMGASMMIHAPEPDTEWGYHWGITFDGGLMLLQTRRLTDDPWHVVGVYGPADLQSMADWLSECADASERGRLPYQDSDEIDDPIAPDPSLVAKIVITPLPPGTLGKNGRAHWAARHAAYQALKQEAYLLLHQQRLALGYDAAPAYPALVMDIVWAQSGVIADDDQIVARCAAIRDAAETVGLVANDRDIRIGTVTPLPANTRASQACVVSFRTPPPGGYRRARGVAPPAPGAELPEDAIRRVRDGT